MDSRQRYLEEQLQRKESETSELRRNLRELEMKFFQLERAFEINLQSQSRRELEFNRMKLESEELRKFNDETVGTRTELNSRLMNAITERDHWKNAFLRQREVIKRNKIDCDDAMALIKQECEDILKMSRETAKKQFHEIVELYNEAKGKVTRLEGQIGTYQAAEREHENRSLELANLLETLKRFDVDVGSVCQLVAEALKNLAERGNLFEENMKNLRHLAWTVKDRVDEPQLVLLREQNTVLREVVKNLKRKMLEQTHHEIPERENGGRHECMPQEIETDSRNINGDLPTEATLRENTVPLTENTINSLICNDNNDCQIKKCKARDETERRATSAAQNNDNRYKQLDIENSIIDKSGRVLCIESHSNGVLFEEYVFKLSVNREIKIKYPISLNNNEAVIRLEFVDNEAAYESAPSDRMLILFKNIYVVVNVKQTGIPCSTQTTKTKTSSSFTQTTMTGISSISRLNVGVTMLNSEKRAIERSLYNLERTVRALKFNALNQAETMINKDSHLLGNDEMLDYIRVLSR